MPKRPWKKYLGPAAFLMLLALVANPELRALLLVSQALGLEAVGLLVLLQLRMAWPLLAAALRAALAALASGATALAVHASGAQLFLLPVRPLALLLGAPLYLLAMLMHGVARHCQRV